jgi:hypothetical protein
MQILEMISIFVQGGKVTILWNQQVLIVIDRIIPNNKPGIVIRNNEKGTCVLIDVTIPGDRNVIQKGSSFGGLVVSMLASGTQNRGFEPSQSRRIFRVKKSSACLPSEGK